MVLPIVLDGNHIYWRPGGIRVPGFSEICQALGVTRPNKFYTESGRERGTAVHAWASHIAQGKTTATAPDARIADRVDAFRTFLDWSGFKTAVTEVPMYDPASNYACTPDLFGHMGVWAWVLDLKTGAKQKTHALQSAAQKIALAANGYRAQKRGSVYLKSKHKIDEHSDPQDEPRWRALVLAYHTLTPAEREIFAAEGFDLESFGREKKARFRIIANAHAARSFYI